MKAFANTKIARGSETGPMSKLSYGGPSIVEAGSVQAITMGHGTPVADVPGGAAGYYDSSKYPAEDSVVDLEGR